MTILEIRQVERTRKPWRCSGCHRKFPAGSPKERQRIIGDDGPYVWQSCPTCTGLSHVLFEMDSDFRIDGVMDDDILEAMQHDYGTWELADAHFGTVTPE